jgi:hypothetical protein
VGGGERKGEEVKGKKLGQRKFKRYQRRNIGKDKK